MLLYSRAPADENDYEDEDESILWPDVLQVRLSHLIRTYADSHCSQDLVERENKDLWDQASRLVPGSPPTKYATPSSMEVNASPAEPDELIEHMDTT